MTAAHDATGAEAWLLVLRNPAGGREPYAWPASVETRAYPRIDLARRAWKKEARYGRDMALYRVDLVAGTVAEVTP